jgi:hypothetical protein
VSLGVAEGRFSNMKWPFLTTNQVRDSLEKDGVQAVTKRFGSNAGPHLLKLIRTSEPAVQRLAVEGLVLTATPELKTQFLALWTEASGEAQQHVTSFLAQSREPAVSTFLLDVLANPQCDQAARASSAEVLVVRDARTGLPAVITALKQCHPDQYSLITSLAQILARAQNSLPEAEPVLLIWLKAFLSADLLIHDAVRPLHTAITSSRVNTREATPAVALLRALQQHGGAATLRYLTDEAFYPVVTETQMREKFSTLPKDRTFVSILMERCERNRSEVVRSIESTRDVLRQRVPGPVPRGEPSATDEGATTMNCVVCGKSDRSQAGVDVVIGRPGSFKDMVGKCQKCGTFVCGACAKPEFKLYAKPEYADAASSFVGTEHLRGRDADELMDEVYKRFGGAELSVLYHCPRCNGQIGPA